jgi:hypothetical protein
LPSWRAAPRSTTISSAACFFGRLQGAAGKPPALDALVLSQAMKSGLQQCFIDTLTHRVSPLNAIGGGQVMRWLLPQVLRGQLGLLRDLWQRGGALAPMQRALAEAVARSQDEPCVRTTLPAWSARAAQRGCRIDGPAEQRAGSASARR